MEKKKISIWRILVYFGIYSILGFIIETLFALILYGVVESRKSYLYGPFSGVYGAGAVVLILTLRYFNKNHGTLFLGGCLMGAITEYAINLIGEVVYKARWWDYSDKFLNINGRICLQYTLFWGVLSVIMIRAINPQVDRLIDYIKSKISIKKLKVFVTICTILMIINIYASSVATNLFLMRKIVEYNLDVENKKEIVNDYIKIYGDPRKARFIYKFWGDKKMISTYPNVTIEQRDGTVIYVHDLVPNVKPYIYKFNEK